MRATENRLPGEQSVHELRSHLGTISLSAQLLGLEDNVTETGRMALKRIDVALDHAREKIEEIERALR